MTREEALTALAAVVEASLPELEEYAKSAKNAPARKRLSEQIERFRTALERAKEAPPRQ